MTIDITNERSRALWRRQVVLTLLVAATCAAVAGLTWLVSRASAGERTRAHFHLQPGDHRVLMIVAFVVGVAVVALLGAVCVHAYRIATLMFRRGDET